MTLTHSLRTQSFDSAVSLSVTRFQKRKEKVNSSKSEYILELLLVFTRFRIGYHNGVQFTSGGRLSRISLTPLQLIVAVFLNYSNFRFQTFGNDHMPDAGLQKPGQLKCNWLDPRVFDCYLF